MGLPRSGLHRYEAAEPTTMRLHVIADGKTTLTVVYTNEESTLNKTLQMYEQWLEEPKQRM